MGNWPSLSYHLSLRSLFCLFLSGLFTQVLLYKTLAELVGGMVVHSLLQIDHEIISTAILLPTADSRRVVVSYKQTMCTKYWLTA